jgi:peptidoglycan/LPS O-acetylase OafA/YrhL
MTHQRGLGSVNKQQRLESLTGLRGVAALAVVLFHAVLAFAPGSPLVHATRALPVAVSFFFILSGFVLTWSWKDQQPLHLFWRDRAARILPIYLVAWLIAVAALTWVRWTPTQMEMLASLCLLQAWVPSDQFPVAVNVPSWSLSCELAFYAALPFVAVRVRRASSPARARMAKWCAVGIMTGGGLALVLPLTYWPLARAPEFLAGVLLATAMQHGWRAGPRTLVAGLLSATTLVILTASSAPLPQPAATLVAVPGFIALIAFVAARDLVGLRTGLISLPMRTLGAWSYSLYLTHWVVVVVISRYLVGAVWIPVGIGASVAVGAAAFLGVERPARRRLRRPSQTPHVTFRPKVMSKSEPTGGSVT